MSEYLVSARKYRPANFNDVVGQKHITATLHNAILNNKIAHAYLFCGPRGVGKTTCARIFAKSVNENTQNEYNIFELDAASNNGVEHIRNLIEQVKIPPQVGKYKVYIIDEVHMLSDVAFNAFLKTLEEPPKHSIFILATTEKNKIIPTILSRCQIFDFEKIGIIEISQHLKKIANKENIQVDDNTLKLIAEQSEGSLRDALSTFDKVSAYFNEQWQHEDVLKILSTLDIPFAITITQHIIENDVSSCLLKINNILEQGFDAREIISILITHLRNLIVVKEPGTIKLVHEETNLVNKMCEQTKYLSKEQLVLGLSCLNEANNNYKNSINKRFLVELCIMQLCSLSFDEKKKKTLIPISKNNHNHTQASHVKKPKSSNDEKNTEAITNDQKDNTETILNDQPSESLISITQELKKELQQKEDTILNRKNAKWSIEEMKQHWDNFSEKLKINKQINSHNIFERYYPIKDENKLLLQVISLSEKSAIEETKDEFTKYIREKLNNDYITLSIILTKKEERNMLYTNEEKYKHIVAKNNKVQILKDKLDLNIL